MYLHAQVITTNNPIFDWGKLIGDVPMATAILERFLSHAKDSRKIKDF